MVSDNDNAVRCTRCEFITLLQEVHKKTANLELLEAVVGLAVELCLFGICMMRSVKAKHCDASASLGQAQRDRLLSEAHS